MLKKREWKHEKYKRIQKREVPNPKGFSLGIVTTTLHFEANEFSAQKTKSAIFWDGLASIAHCVHITMKEVLEKG
jgi:hypothetical protein